MPGNFFMSAPPSGDTLLLAATIPGTEIAAVERHSAYSRTK